MKLDQLIQLPGGHMVVTKLIKRLTAKTYRDAKWVKELRNKYYLVTINKDKSTEVEVITKKPEALTEDQSIINIAFVWGRWKSKIITN